MSIGIGEVRRYERSTNFVFFQSKLKMNQNRILFQYTNGFGSNQFIHSPTDYKKYCIFFRSVNFELPVMLAQKMWICSTVKFHCTYQAISFRWTEWTSTQSLILSFDSPSINRSKALLLICCWSWLRAALAAQKESSSCVNLFSVKDPLGGWSWTSDDHGTTIWLITMRAAAWERKTYANRILLWLVSVWFDSLT